MEVFPPNEPVQSATVFQGTSEFELDAVEAYRDLADWRKISSRFLPLTILRYLGGIEITVTEVERSTKNDDKGAIMLAEPSTAGVDC